MHLAWTGNNKFLTTRQAAFAHDFKDTAITWVHLVLFHVYVSTFFDYLMPKKYEQSKNSVLQQAKYFNGQENYFLLGEQALLAFLLSTLPPGPCHPQVSPLIAIANHIIFKILKTMCIIIVFNSLVPSLRKFQIPCSRIHKSVSRPWICRSSSSI